MLHHHCIAKNASHTCIFYVPIFTVTIVASALLVLTLGLAIQNVAVASADFTVTEPVTVSVLVLIRELNFFALQTRPLRFLFCFFPLFLLVSSVFADADI